MKLGSVTVNKAVLIILSLLMISQQGSADSLKQFFGSIGCNLSKDNQLKNSAAQIDNFVEEKEYLKAWKEFNSNFWQSESNKTMSCYYNLKKDELRKLAIEDLRGLQKNLKEYEGQRDVGKYELFLDGFKEMFGQFWIYTAPGGPMKEPLTGKFYEKHLAIAKQIKANLKKEEDERLDAAEEARKRNERAIAEKKEAEEQKRIEEYKKQEAIKMAAFNAEREAKEKIINEKKGSLGCQRMKAHFAYCNANILHERATKVLVSEAKLAARSGVVNLENKRKYTSRQIIAEEEMDKRQGLYKQAGGVGSIKCELEEKPGVGVSFKEEFLKKLRSEAEKECGSSDIAEY